MVLSALSPSLLLQDGQRLSGTQGLLERKAQEIVVGLLVGPGAVTLGMIVHLCRFPSRDTHWVRSTGQVAASRER